MLHHIVLFKYQQTTTEETRERHRNQLRGLARLSMVRALTVGADVLRSPRSYDTALVAAFDDRDALAEYASHPEHVPVSEFGRQICEHIVAVDYES